MKAHIIRKFDEGALKAFVFHFPDEVQDFRSEEEKSEKSLKLGEMMRWDTVNSWVVKVIVHLLRKADMRENVPVPVKKEDFPLLFLTSFTNFDISEEENQQLRVMQAEGRLEYCLAQGYLKRLEDKSEDEALLAVTLPGLVWMQERLREEQEDDEETFTLNDDDNDDEDDLDGIFGNHFFDDDGDEDDDDEEDFAIPLFTPGKPRRS